MTLKDIHFRHNLRPGDIGYLIHMHGRIYHEEYRFGLGFEKFVAVHFLDFLKGYDLHKDKIWICEHLGKTVGFLCGVHRNTFSAQFRFFILEKAYRGMGLGNALMLEFMDWLEAKSYQHAFLWTTDNLAPAAHLYKKFGFVCTEEIASDQFGVHVNEQKYELDLSYPYQPSDHLA